MMLTDTEIRTLAIEILTAPTARDLQRRVGASDLSDPCDFCLAVKLTGGTRESALSRKTWLGRVLGTSIHGLIEERVPGLLDRLANLPGVQVERHVWFGEIGTYGQVGGSIDFELPDGIVDWKGSTRKKSALMQDYLQSLGTYRVGLPPRWTQQKRGNYTLKFSDCSYSLSAAEYADEMAKQVTKVTRYYGQTQLYLKGSGKRRASLVFVNRDGTGYFDVPAETGYEDEARNHDVWVLSFNYDADYAEALLNRARVIWSKLEAGASPADFAVHEHCFVCGNEDEGDLPDVEVGFGVAA